MRKIYFLLSLITLNTLSIFAQPIVNIPDPLFKGTLTGNSSINLNMDADIDSAEAAQYTGAISIVEVGVSDLTGIEAFYNATGLYASDNNLTTVDLSANTLFTVINIQNNNLTSFIASTNPNLTELSLTNNQLTSLDASYFSNLNYLYVGYNQISNLDLQANHNLWELYCDSNELTSLNLEPNYNLYWLDCRSNNLTSLDVYYNYYLGNVSCGSNPFTCLNMGGNYNLSVFDCSNSPNLQKLNLKTGNNVSMSGVNINLNNCPNLGCIQVDDSTYSANNWIEPANGYWNNDCGIPVASFTHNAPVCSGTPVQFDQTMANVDSFVWDFGDGNTSTTLDPSHLYTYGANFYVELKVISCYGLDWISDDVVLGNPISGYIDYTGGGLTDGEILLLKYEPFYTSFDTIDIRYGFEVAGYYDFQYVLDGQYIIKVHPNNGINPELIPTYSGDQANWETSTIINHTCFAADTMDITMLELPSGTTGPGSLSGEIIEGVGFGRAQGDPIHGVDVKLGFSSNNIIAITQTDTTGAYSFTNLPMGTYTIFVDIAGLLKDSTYTLTIDSSSLNWTYLDYVVDSNSIDIIGNVGVEGIETTEPSLFNVYPNPVKGNAIIKYSVVENTEISFDVYNTFGVKMQTLYNSYTTNGEYLLNFNPQNSGLKSGIYFITLTANGKTQTKRIVVLE